MMTPARDETVNAVVKKKIFLINCKNVAQCCIYIYIMDWEI